MTGSRERWRKRSRRSGRRLGWGTALTLAMLGLAACASGEGAPPVEPLTLLESTKILSDDATEMHSVRLGRADGEDEIVAYLRRPAADQAEDLPAMVLLAGRQAGREAARVLPEDLPFLVLAVEYPEEMPEEVGTLGAIRELGRIRRTAARVPGVLVDAGRILADMDDVDPERISVMGVSFGVPFAAAAGSDPVFSAVILAFGGAGLRDLVAANLSGGNVLTRGIAARLFASRLRELEPARHVPDISPTPLLLVNGIYDDLIPHHTAVRLGEAARPPSEHVWLADAHIGMANETLISEVGRVTVAFLAEAWGREVVERAPATANAVEVCTCDPLQAIGCRAPSWGLDERPRPDRPGYLDASG